MNKTYKVAGHCFRISGERICQAVSRMDGFQPFVSEERDSLFEFIEGTDAPRMEQIQYTFAYEDVSAEFGRWDNGFLLILKR